ncbi:uncharacterized protein K444DRAFT_715156 [Hyaloscypha bicolor E]|uniref:2EXR domain-containing protein n=1 Tax=Hyaloscypha bicolor E TaxID=1095630 RepID=A0A2J6TKD6_9HELO|nr:uncharacterized protein K444DRAFT_715156 [Hyaloscypha bicolor E]PMD63448.1 hypothetical protein K444DRAFT_715156 [Hyaloscypha bicolor E]
MTDDRTNSTTMNTHEQAIDPTALNRPLTEFTVFPTLPPELRQKIFKDALPSGSRGYRVLKVYGTIIMSGRRRSSSAKESKSKPEPNPKAYIEFTLERNSDEHTLKDLALSRSCTESRAVFLTRSPYTLIAKREGLIRFAKDDIIHFIFEAISKFFARMDLMFLSKFEGVGVLGLVWDTGLYYRFEENSAERFIDAALNIREEVHALLKGALHWADDDLPEVHILNSEGERVERSQ